MNIQFTILPAEHETCDLGYAQKINATDYTFHCSPEEWITEYEGIYIFLKGYAIPRNDIFHDWNKYSQVAFIRHKHARYNNGFINYVKGNFIIAIIEKKKIKIFTDHFGLSSFFYILNDKITAVSSSIDLLKDTGIPLVPDQTSLASKSLLHRNVPGYTAYKNIYQTTPATFIELTESGSRVFNYWTPDELLEARSDVYRSRTFAPFAELVKSNFSSFQAQLKPASHTITLTGGKDSRTGLAALQSLGVNPYGFTYGSKNSRDSIYAASLAQNLSLEHHVFDPPSSAEWFEQMSEDILACANPEISIHRTHRLNAFQKMSQITGPGAAYYCGNMAGEFLMGPYYDNLINTEFMTNFWENSTLFSIEPVLQKYQHRTSSVHPDDILDRISRMKSFDPGVSKKMRQFYGMFENGIPHHAQDIFLAGQCFDYVYPFFIDMDFLEALFSSPFSFFHTDNKSKNLLKRYRLFEFNLNIQHILCPAMDEIPFAKRGSYSTKEFLRGRLYWTAVKGLRFFLQSSKYPPSFAYQSGFRDFLNNHLQELNKEKDNLLHEFFDIPKALSDLRQVKFPSPEGPLHRFSNIVMLHRQLKRFE